MAEFLVAAFYLCLIWNCWPYIHTTAFLTELCDMEHLNSTNLQASHSKLKVVCCIAYEICSTRISECSFTAKVCKGWRQWEICWGKVLSKFQYVHNGGLNPRFSGLHHMVPYIYWSWLWICLLVGPCVSRICREKYCASAREAGAPATPGHCYQDTVITCEPSIQNSAVKLQYSLLLYCTDVLLTCQ